MAPMQSRMNERRVQPELSSELSSKLAFKLAAGLVGLFGLLEADACLALSERTLNDSITNESFLSLRTYV